MVGKSDFASLRASLSSRSRGVLVVHPNNPTGSFVKSREAAELAEICSAREMAIVADEVFLDYAGGGEPAPTFAFHDAAFTITLSGLSKISLLPQMKVAWMVVSGPQSLVQTAVERLEIIADTYLSPSTPVQLATPKFLALRHGLPGAIAAESFPQIWRFSMTHYARRNSSRASETERRLVRRVASASHRNRRRPRRKFARTFAPVLVHPGHFFNFPPGWFPDSEPDCTGTTVSQEGVRRFQRFMER